MRNLKKRRILSREKAQRESLLSGLAAALFINKRIETTLAKAKEMKPYTEKIITGAKLKNAARIRLTGKKISKQASKELFEVIAPACLKREGGYLRIMKKPFRESDGASMALVELVDFPAENEATDKVPSGKLIKKGEKVKKDKGKKKVNKPLKNFKDSSEKKVLKKSSDGQKDSKENEDKKE